MIAGYSAAQVRAAEAPHLAAGEALMRQAATALAVVLRRVLRETGAHAGPVVLLVGSGDNGGDALYAGAELADDGVELVAIRTADRVHEEAAAAAMDAGVMVVSRTSPDAGEAFAHAAVIVDGILGTGTASAPALRGGAREVVAAALRVVRKRGIPVVAVDLPSGIHPDDGGVPDPTVLPAAVTVTFGAVKAGLLRAPGSSYAGRVELIDLGLGAELAEMTPLIVSD